MAKVKIYGRSICTYCVTAKDYFKSIDADFEYIIASDDDLVELEKQTGIDTIPQIFIDDKFIGGWVTTKKLIDSGELAKLLNN